MSTRALRKLEQSEGAEKFEIEVGETDSDAESNSVVNRFSLLADDENCVAVADNDACDTPTPQTTKSRGKKKSKPKQVKSKRTLGADENLDAIVASLNSATPTTKELASNVAKADAAVADVYDESALLRIEYKFLRAENELSRLFGVAVHALGENASGEGGAGATGSERRHAQTSAAARKRTQRTAGGRIIQLKAGESRMISKTGLTMKCLEKSSAGVQLFRFEHGPSYQKAQIMFWKAVEKMNPELFVEILREHPCHIDTLLQMSDIYRMNEDFGTARSLVERAIATCEAAFHPLFNPVSNTCRLSYKQQENRPFFLALHKHVQYLCQRACFRTALEFCKLIHSLDPDEDPLGILLFLDYLCLRSKQYDFLINFYYVFEGKRNLSLLPNFCYSIALAKFLRFRKSPSCNDKKHEIDGSIELQAALQKFPTMLPALLDRCSVEPDAQVTKCDAFSAHERASDGKGLQLLYHLYVQRCWSVWKEPEVMLWLESNVKSSIESGCLRNANEKFMELREIRQRRYVTAPWNVLRHVLLGGDELRGALGLFPQHLVQQSLDTFDPLPPPDSRCDYARPQDPTSARLQGSAVGAFFRSLMPNFNPETAAAMEAQNQNGEGEGLQASVQNVLRAMRDLLNDIQLTPPVRENQPEQQAGAREDEDGWADDQLD